MAKTKQEWLYQLRRCSSVNTLEKIIHKNRDSLSTSERESFNSAADLRIFMKGDHSITSIEIG